MVTIVKFGGLTQDNVFFKMVNENFIFVHN